MKVEGQVPPFGQIDMPDVETHDVVVYGVKPFDLSKFEGVTDEQIDQWTATGMVRFGNVIRPMATIALIEIDPE